MRIHVDVLRRYVALPPELGQVRALLDDLGLEVKRLDPGGAMTLELLANRGDHHSYEGLAREVSGRTGAAVHQPEVAALELGPSPWPLRCETPYGLVYTATLLERVGEGALPPEVLAPLEAAGIKSLLPPVDATNLSNLELGQPTHVFDADTLVGAVAVRLSRAGERAWPLFAQGAVELPAGTLVIADDVKILAIAGVIGCEESKTTERTRRILLESATFDPVQVRLAARALGLHTDASARFERGADPSRPLVGAGRVVALLERHAGWRRVGPTGRVGAWEDPARTLRLDLGLAQRFLQHPVGDAAERLARYGFSCAPRPDGALDVRVPPHRLWDVAFAADLYEELARSIGYNNTPTTLPAVDMGSLPTPSEQRRARAEEVLLGQGFYEVITDGFYSRALVEALALPPEHPLRAHVEVQNALDRGYSLLKNNTLAQAVELVALNLRVRNEQIRAYEWTRTFHPRPQPPEGPRAGAPCTERPVLWAVAWGEDRPRAWDNRARPADAWFMKGLVEELAAELRLPLVVGPADPTQPLAACLHPGRQATVRLGGRVVGVLGEVHPTVLRGFKIKRGRPVFLELEAAALEEAGQRPRWEEPPALHPIERSLALTLRGGMTAAQVSAALRAGAPPWLEALDVVDRFDHEDEGEPVHTLTFALRFGAAEDRSAEDVNRAVGAMLDAALAAPGLAGLKLRA